jgi:multimeric flavodoxin WrbA
MKEKDSKKVLVLAGSPRKGGNSDLLSDEFINGALEAGHEIEKIYISDKHINFCIDCEACRKNGGVCVFRDDMGEIMEKMISADVIVLTSPVYFYNFSAQLKTVIDRTFAREYELHDKTAYLIISGAAPVKKYMDAITAAFRGYISCFKNVAEGGIVYGCGVKGKGEITGGSAMLDAYEMGKSL